MGLPLLLGESVTLSSSCSIVFCHSRSSYLLESGSGVRNSLLIMCDFLAWYFCPVKRTGLFGMWFREVLAVETAVNKLPLSRLDCITGRFSTAQCNLEIKEVSRAPQGCISVPWQGSI